MKTIFDVILNIVFFSKINSLSLSFCSTQVNFSLFILQRIWNAWKENCYKLCKDDSLCTKIFVLKYIYIYIYIYKCYQSRTSNFNRECTYFLKILPQCMHKAQISSIDTLLSIQLQTLNCQSYSICNFPIPGQHKTLCFI